MKIKSGFYLVVVAIALFMAFILYYVIKVQTNSWYNNELVTEGYYKKDVHFQDELDKGENVADLKQKPQILNTEKGVEVVFPETFDVKNIKGEISFYRPSNGKLDFKLPIQVSSFAQIIPKSELAGGRWNVTLAWNLDNKDYKITEVIYVK